MKSNFKKLTLCFLLACGLISTAQNKDEIINKHIEAIGGKEAWDKIKTMKMEGSMKLNGAEIKINILQVNKKASRQNISLMGMDGYRILTEKEGWEFMPFQGQTKPEPMTADDIKNGQDELVLQEDFLTYKEMGKKLELLGKDDVDGTECFKIKMINKDGRETTYFLDASSYLTIKQTTKFTVDGKEIESATNFSNYKKLPEGILYPMSIGADWGDTEVSKVEINAPIDEKEFQITQ